MDKAKELTTDPEGEATLTIPRLQDLLRHPDDLEKIPGLKAEYTRKKSTLDSQLREGLRDQLETVQQCINELQESQRYVYSMRGVLKDVDDLCQGSRRELGDFSQIDKLARIQRNFEATIDMKQRLEYFESDLADIESKLSRDDEDLENQPNLLPIHLTITRLREFRDEALDQILKSNDRSSERMLHELFSKLDHLIDWFDDHLTSICMNLIPLVQQDNRSIVVRLAAVIVSEEENDAKVLALQEAKKDHGDLVSRFKSMNVGFKNTRGYKDKFIEAIKSYAREQSSDCREKFFENPDRLDKIFRWFFNDLFTVKEGMQSLMPKKWKIFSVYTNIYHKMMRDFLVGLIDDPELRAGNMLSIVHWADKYYSKMEKLGWKRSDLEPNVLNDRDVELVRDWRNLIVKSLDEWVQRFIDNDKKALAERDADLLATNPDGFFCTKTLGDMWRMLYEQVGSASASQRTDVVEGVINAMLQSLKKRQTSWIACVDDEVAKVKAAVDPADGLQQLQDWLVAIANDQITVIDDNESTGQIAYLSRFRQSFESHVSTKFMETYVEGELDQLRDGYVDLATYCLSAFISLVMSVDFRTTFPDFFTAKWYSGYAMKRVTSTFEDYLADYATVLHPSLIDVLVEELSDELLVRYLGCVRNKGAKFRRSDPYTDKFKDDVLTVFAFFQKYPDSFASTIKDRWRLVDWLVRLLEAEKGPGVLLVYEAFKAEYWDLQLSWVEAVLRCREDFERSMMSSVKTKTAEMSVERGPETLMSKVR